MTKERETAREKWVTIALDRPLVIGSLIRYVSLHNNQIYSDLKGVITFCILYTIMDCTDIDKLKVVDTIIIQRVQYERELEREACSPTGLGAVLSHTMPNGLERPIEFISRTFTAAEKNYAQIDREAAVIVWAVKGFQLYLYGRKSKLPSGGFIRFFAREFIKMRTEIISELMVTNLCKILH